MTSAESQIWENYAALGMSACATSRGQAFFLAMQKALKDDEELAVHCHSGPERLRVVEMFAPSRHVLVVTGTDGERGLARVITTVESLQLVCRIVKVQPGTKPLRIALVSPKQKD